MILPFLVSLLFADSQTASLEEKKAYFGLNTCHGIDFNGDPFENVCGIQDERLGVVGDEPFSQGNYTLDSHLPASYDEIIDWDTVLAVPDDVLVQRTLREGQNENFPTFARQTLPIYSTYRELIGHKEELDLSTKEGLSHEDSLLQRDYRRALEIYDQFQDKDALIKLFGQLKPATVSQYFQKNGKMCSRLRKSVKNNHVVITYDEANQLYQIRQLNEQGLPSALGSSKSLLSQYSTYKELFQHRAELDLITEGNLSENDFKRQGIYRQVFEIHGQFEDKDAFMRLFGKLKPKTILKYFYKKGEISDSMRKRAEKYQVMITYDETNQCYQIRKLNEQDGSGAFVPRLTRYLSFRELIEHREELDSIKKGRISREDVDIKSKYKRALELYDQFEDKDAFVRLFGELKPKTILKYFYKSGEMSDDLKRRAERQHVVITYDKANQRYQIRWLDGQNVPVGSMPRLACYLSCSELLGHRGELDLTKKSGLSSQDSSRKSAYKRILKIYDQFEDKDGFIKLFGESKPSTIANYFHNNGGMSKQLKRRANDYRVVITYDEENQRYQIKQLSNGNNLQEPREEGPSEQQIEAQVDAQADEISQQMLSEDDIWKILVDDRNFDEEKI